MRDEKRSEWRNWEDEGERKLGERKINGKKRRKKKIVESAFLPNSSVYTYLIGTVMLSRAGF